MADNPVVKAGVTGADITVAGDDIGGVIHQRVKVEFGGDGQATEVSALNPLPVDAPQGMTVRMEGDNAQRTQVADTASETQLIGPNPNRKRVKIYNDSTATLYLGEGSTTVTDSNYTVQVPFGALYETDFRGEIRGVWSADPNNGGAKITEVT